MMMMSDAYSEPQQPLYVRKEDGSFERVLLLCPPSAPLNSFANKPSSAAIGWYGMGGAGLVTALALLGAGVTSDNGIYSIAIFAGAAAQMFSGVWELLRGNMVGGVIFSGFAVFWFTYGFIRAPWFTPESVGWDLQTFNRFWGLWNFVYAFICFTWLGPNLEYTYAHLGVTILAISNYIHFGLMGFVTDSDYLITSCGVSVLLTGLLGIYIATSVLYEDHCSFLKLPLGFIKGNPTPTLPREKAQLFAVKQSSSASTVRGDDIKESV